MLHAKSTGPDSALLLADVVNTLRPMWRQGRKALVVLGAGASAAAKVPTMCRVFEDLEARLFALRKRLDREGSSLPSDTLSVLDDLALWLGALKEKNAPRSISAMALGMLQKAHEQVSRGELFNELKSLWAEFSSDFTLGLLENKGIRSPKGIARDPTDLHRLVAEWAVGGLADVISVNFDGLTYAAIGLEVERLNKAGENLSAVVLSEPEELKKYFLGDVSDRVAPHRLVPVIKVWGDVFHAVCTNAQCPQTGAKQPIFRLAEGHATQTGDPANEHRRRIACPVCAEPRQLQIFFAGYEEKERSTTELMKLLMKYVAPQTGCIFTIGFSGLWDQALVSFLGNVAIDLDRESTWRHRLNLESLTETDMESKGLGRSPLWFHVDPELHPSLIQDVAPMGICPLHLKMESEHFARSLRKSLPDEPIGPVTPRFDGFGSLEEGMWDQLAKDREEPAFPGSFQALMENRRYLQKFGYLRQLGFKTRLSMGGDAAHVGSVSEEAHNRRLHSFGSAKLAAIWARKLMQSPLLKLTSQQQEQFATVAVFAGVHHDTGHLPFSHLAEEVFEEVHWSLENWSDAFRHDEPVLANCCATLRPEVFLMTNNAAKIAGVNPAEFRYWLECAIQGRSGCTWLDAIINSPLDVDKLDYVFRDCQFLKQGTHVSTLHLDKWMENLFDHTRVLPSGLVAFEGLAGEQARDFLEERRWLYKHQYFQTGFRALERLASAVILQWLLQHVTDNIAGSAKMSGFRDSFGAVLGDTSAIKGRTARDLLWQALLAGSEDGEGRGETQLLLTMTRELAEPTNSSKGFPRTERLTKWAQRCLAIFESALNSWRRDEEFSLLGHLRSKAGLTCSDCFYIPFSRLKTARSIVRELETLHPFRALFDLAVIPRMLSYPSRRRLKWGSETVLGECFAVAHRDPDRWGRATNRWIPLSESAYAEADTVRWVQIMAVSPHPMDPHVQHAIERFHSLCREKEIPIAEVDPDTKSS